jgi:hypothetical protein
MRRVTRESFGPGLSDAYEERTLSIRHCDSVHSKMTREIVLDGSII